MKTTKLLLAAVATVSLAFGMATQAEQRSEMIDLKTLPAAVQKTITEKAAGGKVVRVQREDDKNGKWNYEVIVKTNGKEWGFEVDPGGKYLKKHVDAKKTE